MSTDYLDYHQHLEERLAQLGRELPGPMGGFARLHRKVMDDGALPGKVKELMAWRLALSSIAMAALPTTPMTPSKLAPPAPSYWKPLA
jgi:hypothetical protein